MKAIISTAALSFVATAATADVTLINVFEVPNEKLETELVHSLGILRALGA